MHYEVIILPIREIIGSEKSQEKQCHFLEKSGIIYIQNKGKRVSIFARKESSRKGMNNDCTKTPCYDPEVLEKCRQERKNGREDGISIGVWRERCRIARLMALNNEPMVKITYYTKLTEENIKGLTL